VGLSAYFPIIARQRLGKDVPAAMKICWINRFQCRPCRVKEIRPLVLPITSCYTLRYIHESATIKSN
jgi:hypothetical protein